MSLAVCLRTGRAEESGRRTMGGFSLVEVILALGIAAFALVAIVALLPIGLKSAGDSSDENRAINLLNAIVASRHATPYEEASVVYRLPALTGVSVPVSGTFGVSEDDVVTTDLENARYRVDYRILPPASGGGDPYIVRLRVAWPAKNVTSPKVLETVAAYPQP